MEQAAELRNEAGLALQNLDLSLAEGMPRAVCSPTAGMEQAEELRNEAGVALQNLDLSLAEGMPDGVWSSVPVGRSGVCSTEEVLMA